MKQQLLAAYGGSDATEAAVAQGLTWLATNQQGDGSWSLIGPYRNGIADSFENKAAATAMALLAFQGAGQTNQVGEFSGECAKGWRWLLKQQDKEGNFLRTAPLPLSHQFYTAAQCTMALCELYQMTEDETYREPAELAVSHLLNSQADDGGWRYHPGSTDGDTSVTAWVVTALQTARMAGLEVPEGTLRRADGFLDTVAHQDGSQYRYRPNKEPRPSMTAAGLLCRQYLGWARDDPRMIAGVEYLTQPENLIDYQTEPNVYYWYYATQVCHNMGGRYWDTWNEVMRDELPRQQVKTGDEKGSWYPSEPHEDAWAREGGRLYVTCLSLYVLETYYRHLPIYTDLYQPGEEPLALDAKETTEAGGQELDD
jgi:hypothetical protein